MKIQLTLLALCAVSSSAFQELRAETVATPSLTPEKPLSIIPWPADVQLQKGNFKITADTVIVSDAAFAQEARGLAKQLNVKVSAKAVPGTTIAFKKTKGLAKEAYALHVSAEGVEIEASSAAGAYYATRTLGSIVTNQTIPAVTIKDEPRIPWRGFMLDVSRSYFDKEEVKELLDHLASLKFNVFHWHLTDDNGWRIEIKKYPKLTSVGAWRAPNSFEKKGGKHVKNGLYGGFYTQEDIREVIAYAAARHIRVIPEIDIPGHVSAIVTAYPEFSPKNGWTPMIPVSDRRGGGKNERCAAMNIANPAAVRFCKDVLDEVMALFPAKEIHIGGDEVFYEQWETCPDMLALKKKLGVKDWEDVQVAFGNELIKHIENKGRTAICWNNIYRKTIDKRCINHFWRSMKPAKEFANAGHPVVLSEKPYYYLTNPRRRSVEEIYNYDPMNLGTTKAGSKMVRGIEACYWSELTYGMRGLDRKPYTFYARIFPHLIAISEGAWTPLKQKNWASFQQRLKHHPFTQKSFHEKQ